MRRPLPVALDRRVRARAKDRCGYCLAPQRLVLAPLEIEHIIPVARGGSDDEDNLWLGCPVCNGHKAAKTHAADPDTGASVPLFNPRSQQWAEHFRWSDDGIRVVGLTQTGRATVVALHLDDDPLALMVRSNWAAAGWHPPTDE
jgi:hypothetical protein